MGGGNGNDSLLCFNDSLFSRWFSPLLHPPSSDSSSTILHLQLKYCYYHYYYYELFCILAAFNRTLNRKILWTPFVSILFTCSHCFSYFPAANLSLFNLLSICILDPASDVASHPVSWCQQWLWKLSENVFHSPDLGVLLKTWNLLFRSHLHILWNFLWWSTDQHIQQSDFRN